MLFFALFVVPVLVRAVSAFVCFLSFAESSAEHNGGTGERANTTTKNTRTNADTARTHADDPMVSPRPSASVRARLTVGCCFLVY